MNDFIDKKAIQVKILGGKKGKERTLALIDVLNGIITAIKRKKIILVCGNGGSCSMASHFVGELIGKFEYQRMALPAISLNNPDIITAIANDTDFDEVFARQIEAYKNNSSILMCFTTSDANINNPHSRNLLKAISKAKKENILTVVIGSNKTKNLAQEADIIIKAEGKTTAEIQENQLKLLHTICREVEEYFIYYKPK